MPEIPADKDNELPPYSPEYIPETGEIAYNLDEETTPGGMKVRWKIRIARGKEAERVAARQAEAIRELLTWATHRQQQDQDRRDRATRARASRASRRSR
jgi:hypothetical protein